MIKPSYETTKALAQMITTYPYVLTFFDDWYNKETKALPLAVSNVGQAQGRCQVLGELSRLLHDVKEMAAKV